jgi:hypothetical protein
MGTPHAVSAHRHANVLRIYEMKTRPAARVVKSFAAVALAAVVAPASAVEIVTDWNYYFRAAWTNFTPAAGPGAPFGVTADTPTAWSDPGARGDFLPTRLRWGQTTPGSSSIDPDRQSSLEITPRAQSGPAAPNPVLRTNETSLPTFDISHSNLVIYRFDQALDSTNLVTNVTLQPRTPLGDPFTAETLTFLVNFEETRNQDPNCAVGGPDGCSDIFVLNGLENLTRTIPGDVFGERFAGVDYLATITLQGLLELPDAACATAGAPEGCRGFITSENQVNTFTAFFNLSAEVPAIRAVPEPALLSLIGLIASGLGCLGLRRRG